MDKSRSTRRTDTENTINKVNKSRSILRTSLSKNSTKIENSEIDISNDNLSISVFPGQREILSSATPDKQRIPRKNKIKKTSETLKRRKETIQETFNPSKRAKKDTIPDV